MLQLGYQLGSTIRPVRGSKPAEGKDNKGSEGENLRACKVQ